MYFVRPKYTLLATLVLKRRESRTGASLRVLHLYLQLATLEPELL